MRAALWFYARSGNPVREQVPVLIHRTGQRTDANDVIGYLHHLGYGPNSTFTDNQPCTFSDERWIAGFIEERPR